jgi:carboxymethylenebutenolidase
LLLLHELGGINPALRATAGALTQEGYVVFTPDLYAGRTGLRAMLRLIMGAALYPVRNQPLLELRAILQTFRSRPDVDFTRIGVIGYSMGAAYALQLACVESSLSVAAVFCGQLPRPVDALRNACPIVASYAGRDLTCRDVAERLERTLDRYGIEHDLKTYRTVAHAFYDPWGPMYDAIAARDAWARTLEFIRLRLCERAA